MSTSRADVDAAVAGLRARWGAAAPRVAGALALAPAVPALAETPDIRLAPGTPSPTDDDRVIHTGFAALDAILGPGGLPRSASVAIRGDGSSGRTTLALRVAAEAQAQGSVVAWLDLSRSFDPVEAATRGIRLEWLVVITPASLDEGLSIAGSLLAGRSVDMLVLDLPGGRLAKTDKPARVADRLHRLAALARRAETLLLIIDAPGTGAAGGLATAIDQSTGIRLELARRSWVRLGRDVVGQRTEAVIAHNRHGPPGRRATLRILYAEGGERDACLAHDALLLDVLEAREAPETPDAREATAAHALDARAAPEPPPPVATAAPDVPDAPHVHPHEVPAARVASDARMVAPGRQALHPTHATDDLGHASPVFDPLRVDPLYLVQEPAWDGGPAAVPATVRASDARRPDPASAPAPAPAPPPVHVHPHEAPDRKTHDHATSPPPRPASAPPPGSGPTLRAVPAGPARAGRPTVGPGSGHRRQPGRAPTRRPTRHAAGERPPARP